MLDVETSGDYARCSGRLGLMTSSRRHLATDVRLSDDDDCGYASTLTSSSLLTGEMGSYEAFSKFNFRLESDGSTDENMPCYSTTSRKTESMALRSRRGVEFNSFVSEDMMAKSSSSPSHSITSNLLPDPFPELTKSQLAPVSARMYDMSPASSKLADKVVTSPTRGGSPPGSTVATPQTSSLSERVSMNFYTDEHNFNELTIDGDTTAAAVCDRLIQRNLAIPSPQWTLVESIGRYRLERGIEHHENVRAVFKTWSDDDDSRFLFRKDFAKYELFRNPVQFFPEHMVDCKMAVREDGWLTRSERYKNLLLQNLLANQSIPDIQGYLHIRDKRSWKKHFCVLRGSGLYYSTKGTQKEPQYLALLSTLEEVNIFTSHNSKKIFGAPTNYGFCLKPFNGPTDAKQFKLFCVDDEQSRLCWLTGMRFVKYGAQLRENFRLSLRCDEENGGSSSDGINSRHNNNALYVKSRVPMDFSGDRGHVVTDPNEALSIAYEEAYNWRKKSLTRYPQRPPVQGCCSNIAPIVEQVAAVSQALSTRQYPVQVANSIHLMQPWFHGNIRREDAISLITEQGLVDGVFLIRNSQSIPNVYVLSFAHNLKVKHCTINKVSDGDGQLYYSLDGGTTKFMDLIQLVDFYQLNSGALPTQLKYHITRL